MQEFKNCPRCNRDFDITDSTETKCNLCNLHYSKSFRYMAIYNILDGYNLYWKWNIKGEIYCHFDFAIYSSNPTILPFLPYDITAEKLKLYLNFI